MNEIREIVTKAVIAKGKKTVNLKETINPDYNTYSILGVWIINHEFDVLKKNDAVEIKGCFETNIWVSYDENTKTNIVRKKVDYETTIHVRQVVTDFLEDSEDAFARILKHPTAVNARIVDSVIELEIAFEIKAEVIGETKMQVTVFSNPAEVWDVDDFENEIDENFLEEK